ncbi:hypothetical protein Misp01_82590 [Microtetraspora sp. NBRC 13810]|uniref:DoxX family protein n=1 Tax=Microtetraspora sp. NBRC 13810 TaxID=3030990 RepID=UPI0024A32F59|nr:DoxX family protein [Microtetraspora sp. NBRC 13810]GLW13131.1 hypothetical protein Misp01_82590 [Microtetraspora sp. NBRC 13810]
MRRIAYDVAALVARLVVGVVFLAHGLQKAGNGLDATAASFRESGVPLAHLSAAFTTAVEVAGGAMLLFGLLTPLVGVGFLLITFGAVAFVHGANGIFAKEGGWELIAALGAAALLLAAGGAGRFSLDHLLFGRRGARSGEALPYAAPGGPLRDAHAPVGPQDSPYAPPLDLPAREEGGNKEG